MGVFHWCLAPQHFKMIRYFPFFFVFVLSSNAQNCGDFTTKDVEGPFFVEGVPLDLSMATDDEGRDPSLATILRGKVIDRNCRAVTGATVDVWYAGGGSGSGNAEYSFRPEKLLHRGKTITGKNGDYGFVASFPQVYAGRPIPHYHIMITTRGRRGITFITQVYFRGQIPKGFEDYVISRGSQYGRVTRAQPGSALPNGGRTVNFNVRLNIDNEV